MAGGQSFKNDPKKIHTKNNFGTESLPESQLSSPPPAVNKISLRGILGIGQTIEFNKPAAHSQEIFSGINHLQQEAKILFDQRQKELTKALEELRKEIASLAKSTDHLEKSIENVAITEIAEVSEYQVNFFIRIRNFIANVRQNISEAALWVQAFAAKKKKKNYFWNTAKNKKKGGDAFMFSDESGVSRSIG